MKEKAALLQKYRGKTDYNKKLNLEVSIMDPDRQFYRRDRTDKLVGESGQFLREGYDVNKTIGVPNVPIDRPRYHYS